MLAPLLALLALAVFVCDFRNPLFFGRRIGKDGRAFRMVKLRTMRSSTSGPQSTSAFDPRITWIGRILRRCKLDELPQLWNVLLGEMSFVGPRPQVESEVRLYTDAEHGLLRVRPGITDLASIVFSDESGILAGHSDPDAAYRRWIRPWKSRIALTAIEHASIRLTFQTLLWTLINCIARRRALGRVATAGSELDHDRRLARARQRQREAQATQMPLQAMACEFPDRSHEAEEAGPWQNDPRYQACH